MCCSLWKAFKLGRVQLTSCKIIITHRVLMKPALWSLSFLFFLLFVFLKKRIIYRDQCFGLRKSPCLLPPPFFIVFIYLDFALEFLICILCLDPSVSFSYWKSARKRTNPPQLLNHKDPQMVLALILYIYFGVQKLNSL